MFKYLNFHNFSFALRYFLMYMARPWYGTPPDNSCRPKYFKTTFWSINCFPYQLSYYLFFFPTLSKLWLLQGIWFFLKFDIVSLASIPEGFRIKW
jgi:hypothetical protein